MSVLIEKYRGFEIKFDANSEEFYTELDEYGKRSKSFSAIKSGVDEFIKDNVKFEPFEVINLDGHRDAKTYKVIGIRKDGRFVYDKDGKKEQISDYGLNKYKVRTPELDNIVALNAIDDAEADTLRRKVRDRVEAYIGLSLADLKEKYAQLIQK